VDNTDQGPAHLLDNITQAQVHQEEQLSNDMEYLLSLNEGTCSEQDDINGILNFPSKLGFDIY
jgi:hypothetical protein